MDKRKSFTISDKLQLVRQILEAAEDHNKVELEMTIVPELNKDNCFGELCEKFNLHKTKTGRDFFNWIWYHNGKSKSKKDLSDANIKITVFSMRG